MLQEGLAPIRTGIMLYYTSDAVTVEAACGKVVLSVTDPKDKTKEYTLLLGIREAYEIAQALARAGLDLHIQGG